MNLTTSHHHSLRSTREATSDCSPSSRPSDLRWPVIFVSSVLFSSSNSEDRTRTYFASSLLKASQYPGT
jgi:hypothetical protein